MELCAANMRSSDRIKIKQIKVNFHEIFILINLSQGFVQIQEDSLLALSSTFSTTISRAAVGWNVEKIDISIADFSITGLTDASLVHLADFVGKKAVRTIFGVDHANNNHEKR